MIDTAVTLIVQTDGTVDVAENGETRRIRTADQSAYFVDCLTSGRKFICFDAVDIHRKLLAAATTADSQATIWNLSSSYALWDIGLLEQRSAWSTEGRALSFPDILSLLQKYKIPAADQHACLRELLRCQFRYLIENLPILRNDVAGRRIFREREYDSPYIDPTDRIVTRRNVHYKERIHPFLPLVAGWRKYGPGCVGLDVQGAIVADHLAQVPPRICADPTTFSDRQRNIIREISQDVKLAACYQDRSPWTDPGTGMPIYSPKAGEKITQFWWSESAPNERGKRTGDARQYRLYPLDPDSRSHEVAADYLHPGHWGESIPQTGPLRLWSDYQAISKAWHHAHETPMAPLAYESVPYMQSEILDYVEKSGRSPFFAASPGHKLLVLQIRSLSLFCYAWNAELSYSPFVDIGAFDLLPPRMYQVSANIDRDRFELSPCKTTVLKDHREGAYWHHPVDLRRTRAFSESEFLRSLSYAVLTGIFSPHIREPLDSEASWDAFSGSVAAITDRFSNAFFEWFSANTGQTDEVYVQPIVDEFVSDLPDWLRRNDHFTTLARIVFEGFVRGHSVDSIIAFCRNRFDDREDRSVVIRNIYGGLATRTSFRSFDALFFPLGFLAKAGIDPCVANASLDRLTMIVDGRELPIGHTEEDIADPMLRKSMFQAVVRNTLLRHSNAGHKRLWQTVILPLFRERFEELEISTDEGTEGVYDFFYKTSALSAAGTPGRPVMEIEKPYESWPVFADDIRKSAAHALIRRGGKLLAVAGNSFLLEISELENTPERCRDWAGIVQDACRSLLDFDFFQDADKTAFCVPPAVTFQVGETWPHAAQ